MRKTIVLKENNEAIRKKIEEAGIGLCPCASFKDSIWLDYSGITPNIVHGVGYPFECETQEEHLKRFVEEVRNPVWCDNVEQFIKEIKNYDR